MGDDGRHYREEGRPCPDRRPGRRAFFRGCRPNRPDLHGVADGFTLRRARREGFLRRSAPEYGVWPFAR